MNRMEPEREADVVLLLRAGCTFTEAADAAGVSFRSVGRIAKRHGFVSAHHEPDPTPEEQAEIKARTAEIRAQKIKAIQAGRPADIQTQRQCDGTPCVLVFRDGSQTIMYGRKF